MVKELGEGGFGKVLLGVHRTTREKVAIKIVKTSLIGEIIIIVVLINAKLFIVFVFVCELYSY